MYVSVYKTDLLSNMTKKQTTRRKKNYFFFRFHDWKPTDFGIYSEQKHKACEEKILQLKRK